MRSHEQRRRSRFGLGLELLEGRIAPSSVSGLEHGGHAHRGKHTAAEVHHGSKHDKATTTTSTTNSPHTGLDDSAQHNAADDNLPKHSGKDKRSGHK